VKVTVPLPVASATTLPMSIGSEVRTKRMVSPLLQPVIVALNAPPWRTDGVDTVSVASPG
jgi:hypothetical protein